MMVFRLIFMHNQGFTDPCWSWPFFQDHILLRTSSPSISWLWNPLNERVVSESDCYLPSNGFKNDCSKIRFKVQKYSGLKLELCCLQFCKNNSSAWIQYFICMEIQNFSAIQISREIFLENCNFQHFILGLNFHFHKITNFNDF